LLVQFPSVFYALGSWSDLQQLRDSC
jgi:hypothetical protein